MRKLCSALGAACLVVALCGSAAAQEMTAKDHFLKGTKYFDLGHFDEAIKEYEAAYEIKDEPVLLYNIAQAHRLAGHSKEAVHFYRSYLRRVPKATNRDEVETKIAEISKLIEQQEKTRALPPDLPMSPGEQHAAATKPRPSEPPPKPVITTPPPATTPPAEQPPVATTPPVEQPPTPPPAVEPKPASAGFFGGPGKVKKIVGIALLGVGVAALAVGGAMSAMAVGAGNDVQAEANAGQPFDPAKESTGKTDQVIGGVMYGVGGAAAVVGGVMLFLGVREDNKAASSHAMLVLPVLSPTQAGAAFQIRF